MKASRLDDEAKVRSFRLNDKCAAGTGAFLEKTARYMGYSTAEIGPLVATSKEAVTISGVCAVFAESEVINQLSQGAAPADIMYGAIVSLVGRSVQLLKRVRLEPELTLIGGILRFERGRGDPPRSRHGRQRPTPSTCSSCRRWGAVLAHRRSPRPAPRRHEVADPPTRCARSPRRRPCGPSAPGASRHPARLAAGWERRFVTDVARAEEAVSLYQGMGYEVVADPVVPEDLDEGCDSCALATLFRTVYTRRRPE
jgi:hypothetical protein